MPDKSCEKEKKEYEEAQAAYDMALLRSSTLRPNQPSTIENMDQIAKSGKETDWILEAKKKTDAARKICLEKKLAWDQCRSKHIV